MAFFFGNQYTEKRFCERGRRRRTFQRSSVYCSGGAGSFLYDNGDCICGETRTSGSRGGTVCGRCEMDFKVPERQQSV